MINLDLSLFSDYLAKLWTLVNTPFTLFGYTFTWANFFIIFLLVDFAAFIIWGLLRS